ncbi:MAG: carbon-nitrogen hydrolase family protein [Specibacter sp.]
MRIALAQIISSANPVENLSLIRRYTSEAAGRGAGLVVFPEAAMCAFGNPVAEAAEPLEGPWAAGVRELAREFGVTIVAGMFTPGTGGRVKNTLLVAGPAVDARYEKIHLYDAFGFAESESVEPGTGIGTFELDGTLFGLATCYDVRFPQLFTANADAGASVSIVCASWGAGPGKAEQWDLLVRARALDSTSFVLACGQGDPSTAGADAAGGAPTGIGRSAVISPLGEVVERLDGGAGLLVADLDLGAVDKVRAILPVLANRRGIVAGQVVPETPAAPSR